MRIIILSFLFIFACSCSYEKAYKDFYQFSFSAEVDSIKHPPLNPIFEQQQYTIWLDSTAHEIPFTVYTPVIEKLEVGDSLYKEKNTWNLTLKRNTNKGKEVWYYDRQIGWKRIK